MSTATHVETRCPNPECGYRYRIKPEHVGKSTSCKQCGQRFVLVPDAGASPPPQADNTPPLRESDESQRIGSGPTSNKRVLMITFSCFGLAMAALGSWFYVATRTPRPAPVLAERSLDRTGDVAPPLSRPEAGVPTSAEIPGADDAAVDRSESPNAARAGDPTAVAKPDSKGPVKPDRRASPSDQPPLNNDGTSRNVQAAHQSEEETKGGSRTVTLEEASPNAPATDEHGPGGVPAIKAIKWLDEPKLSKNTGSTAIVDLAVSSNGQYVVARHVQPICIRVWDLDTNQPQAEITPETSVGQRKSLWMFVSNRVAVVDDQVLVPGVLMGTMGFELRTAKPVYSFRASTGRQWMATSANGKLVASREGRPSWLKIRDVATDVVILKMSGKSLVVSLSPTGDLLAGAYRTPRSVKNLNTKYETHDVTVWELPSGRAIGTCTDMESTATFLLFPPTEDWVAIGRADKSKRGPKQHLPILRYDFRSGEKIGVIGTADIEQIVDAVFLPGGKLMALADGRGTIHIWNVEKEAVGAVLIGHKGAVNSLVVLPDGKTLISGGTDGTIKFWDVAQIVRSVWPASFSDGSLVNNEQPTQTPVAVDLHEAVTKDEASVSLTIPSSVAAQEKPAQTPMAVDLYEAVTKNEVSVSLTIPGTHQDLFGPQDHPFDAQLTLKKESRSRSPIRIVIKPGTVIGGSDNSVVLIDEITLDLPPDLDEKTIPVKAYLRRIPAGRYGMGGDYRRPKEGWKHVYSIPDLHAASDPVRQAVVWITKGASYGKYAEVYSTRYTGKSGGVVTRTDPFQITKDQWGEAQRIVKIVTPQRQRELDLMEAEKLLHEERQRLGAKVLAEAKAKAKAQIEQAERLEADRKARTKILTLLEALDDGLVTASIDALIAPPESAKLTIAPTPALGTTILDLIVPAGTVVREASGGGGKTAYLKPARIEVELPDPSSIRIRTYLRTLDDAGSGTFVFDRTYPLAAILLSQELRYSASTLLRTGKGGQYLIRFKYGDGEYSQLVILEHGDKGKPYQQWRQDFTARGLDDPYVAITAAFKEAGGDPHAALIHRGIQESVMVLEHMAEQIASPDGLTYPESDIVGRWRLVKSRQAVDVQLDLAARSALRSSMSAQFRQTLDPEKVERAIRGMYNTHKINLLEIWKGHGALHLPLARIERIHDEGTSDLTLRSDRTFEVDYGRSLKNENLGGHGTWTWDGRVVQLAFSKDDPRRWIPSHREVSDPLALTVYRTRALSVFQGFLMAGGYTLQVNKGSRYHPRGVLAKRPGRP